MWMDSDAVKRRGTSIIKKVPNDRTDAELKFRGKQNPVSAALSGFLATICVL